MFSKKLLIILFLIIIIAFIAIAFLGGFWAVAFVNKSAISRADFDNYYKAASSFYKNDLKAADKDPKLLDLEEAKKELQKATLRALIENKLIDQELTKILDDGALNFMIDEKIAKTDFNSDNFKKGVEVVYGLSLQQAKEIILIPKAKEEILAGRLFADGKNLEEWLIEKKKSSVIIITTPGFYWEDGEVKTK